MVIILCDLLKWYKEGRALGRVPKELLLTPTYIKVFKNDQKFLKRAAKMKRLLA
jgi:hypothetical protein